MKTVPEWVIDCITEWKSTLLLQEWTFETSLSPHPGGDGSGHTSAHITLWPDIRRAQLEIRDDIPDESTREWRKTIIHELVHVRLAGITELVNQELIPELPGNAQEIAAAVFRREVEPVVELLAGILLELSGDPNND
jgi:hypothetical protein